MPGGLLLQRSFPSGPRLCASYWRGGHRLDDTASAQLCVFCCKDGGGSPRSIARHSVSMSSAGVAAATAGACATAVGPRSTAATAAVVPASASVGVASDEASATAVAFCPSPGTAAVVGGSLRSLLVHRGIGRLMPAPRNPCVKRRLRPLSQKKLREGGFGRAGVGGRERARRREQGVWVISFFPSVSHTRTLN